MHLIFLEHHKVEVLDPLLGIVAHTLHERGMANDITNIFIDELIPVTDVSYRNLCPYTMKDALLYVLLCS
jgi:hypothetical protein